MTRPVVPNRLVASSTRSRTASCTTRSSCSRTWPRWSRSRNAPAERRQRRASSSKAGGSGRKDSRDAESHASSSLRPRGPGSLLVAGGLVAAANGLLSMARDPGDTLVRGHWLPGSEDSNRGRAAPARLVARAPHTARAGHLLARQRRQPVALARCARRYPPTRLQRARGGLSRLRRKHGETERAGVVSRCAGG